MLNIELRKEIGVLEDLSISVSGVEAEILLNILEDWQRLIRNEDVNQFASKRGLISKIFNPTGRGSLAPWI